MKAMILAAGLGARLSPLTDKKPKALVEINGVPLLEIVIKKLISFGFDEIIVNVHHFAGMIVEYLKRKNNFNIRIEISDESERLLDTGGGLKKAAWFFNDEKPFILHNVDILTDLDLKQFYSYHLSNKALATLAVRDRKSSRYLLFDEEKNLCGWESIQPFEKKISRAAVKNLMPFAFSGIHVIDPKIFSLMPPKEVFSIIDFYLMIAANHEIKAFEHNNTSWNDIGSIKKLEEFKNSKTI